jgi:hypothetical protein
MCHTLQLLTVRLAGSCTEATKRPARAKGEQGGSLPYPIQKRIGDQVEPDVALPYPATYYMCAEQ